MADESEERHAVENEPCEESRSSMEHDPDLVNAVPDEESPQQDSDTSIASNDSHISTIEPHSSTKDEEKLDNDTDIISSEPAESTASGPMEDKDQPIASVGECQEASAIQEARVSSPPSAQTVNIPEDAERISTQGNLQVEDGPILDRTTEMVGDSQVAVDIDQGKETKPAPSLNGQSEDSVKTFYRGKCILLTGATGFIGKAVLWKLMHSLGGEIGKVFLLIRNGGSRRSRMGSTSDRVKSEILNNKAFISLRRILGPSVFDAIVKEKIIPIAGDIISPDLSLSESDREAILRDTNVVIHCAATMDYQERLDLSLETNTLGTLRLMDLADDCQAMEAFVHMSLGYHNRNIPDGDVQERVYPMELGDPEELLRDMVNTELEDIGHKTEEILKFYPNTYTFTKSLTEHLILKRVDANRLEEVQTGKAQWPMAIVRVTQVGAGLSEPLPGWVDGMTGFNSSVYLMGRGQPPFIRQSGDMIADIVPVDYLARVIVGCPVYIHSPGCKFVLSYNEVLSEQDTTLPSPDIVYFPYVYQVTAGTMNSAIKVKQVYDICRSYWVRSTRVSLPTTQDRFTPNKMLTRARTLMRTVSSALGNSINNGLANRLSDRSSRNDAQLEMANRIVEAILPFMSHSWKFEHTNTRQLQGQLESSSQFSLTPFQDMDWENYILCYCFGVHMALTQGSFGLRNVVVPDGWSCALYPKRGTVRRTPIERDIESVVYAKSDIHKRTQRMVDKVIASLENPGENAKDVAMEEWIQDFDASLDDWCHDDAGILEESSALGNLGYWASSSAEPNDQIVDRVLKDKRVETCIQQIVSTTGVPEITARGEAEKILQRMRERTQVAYIWFAGAFLDALFKRLFSSIRVREDEIRQFKTHIEGKRVVYIPTSKTLLDQLLVWYVCIRYDLPVPILVHDEALALLGPLSDIFRIVGACFLRRDRAARSPLNSAVGAAYISAILRDHGALSILINKARSRTGRLQSTYMDGTMSMVLDSLNDPSIPYCDTVLVPVHIIYEKMVGLENLIDQVLDQKQPKSTPPPSTTKVGGLVRSASMLRPSLSAAGRGNGKDNLDMPEKYGRVFVGFGQTVDAKRTAQEASVPSDGLMHEQETQPWRESTERHVMQVIQHGHCRATIASPVAMVASIVLYGRHTNGISLGDTYGLMDWLADCLRRKNVLVDWHDQEDTSTVVAYALRRLDAHKHIIMDDKRRTERSLVHVVDHSDNVLALSYMANQMIDLLLPESLLAIALVSRRSGTSRGDMERRFRFLARLFRSECVFPGNVETVFDSTLTWFIKEGLLLVDDGDYKIPTEEADKMRYQQLHWIASLLLPTLDTYWITSCALSALLDIPYMPRKTVPLLSQWIAAHLISGRRTIYREVLSTDVCQSAMESFLSFGSIVAAYAKEVITPDAQVLLLELGVPTNDVMISRPPSDAMESDDSHMDDLDRELIHLGLLCKTLETYRLPTDVPLHTSTSPSPRRSQVFEKCQKQIRSILHSEKGFAAQRGVVSLNHGEDKMLQLVYSLKVSTITTTQTTATTSRMMTH